MSESTKMSVKHLVYNQLIHSLKSLSQNIFIIYKEEYYNFIVEKTGRHHLNEMIKIIIVNSISNGKLTFFASWYDALRNTHQFCDISAKKA